MIILVLIIIQDHNLNFKTLTSKDIHASWQNEKFGWKGLNIYPISACNRLLHDIVEINVMTKPNGHPSWELLIPNPSFISVAKSSLFTQAKLNFGNAM
ncbi:MAG: hypothetical protein ACKESC_01700 [Candidatus Hodgkinia cicadicola]